MREWYHGYGTKSSWEQGKQGRGFPQIGKHDFLVLRERGRERENERERTNKVVPHYSRPWMGWMWVGGSLQPCKRFPWAKCGPEGAIQQHRDDSPMGTDD